jgi:hypothetical protein
LAYRAPQRFQGGQPTEIELVGVVAHVTRFQVVAGVFDRFFF